MFSVGVAVVSSVHSHELLSLFRLFYCYSKLFCCCLCCFCDLFIVIQSYSVVVAPVFLLVLLISILRRQGREKGECASPKSRQCFYANIFLRLFIFTNIFFFLTNIILCCVDGNGKERNKNRNGKSHIEILYCRLILV